LQTQIADYKIQEGISVKGKVEEIKVKQAQFDADSLSLGVQFIGAVEVLIDSIPA